MNGKLTMWLKDRKCAKKSPFFVPKNIGINRRHNRYFQVQGQMHIAKRNLFYFAIWVGDDSFWKTKMKNRLITYNSCHTCVSRRTNYK